MTLLENLQNRRTSDNSSRPGEGQVSFRGRRWVSPQVDDLALKSLLGAGHSRQLARILASRGHDAESAPDYLEPDLRRLIPEPTFFRDLIAAAERIARAVAFGERIAIWGDYDVDGATSSAILARILRVAGVGATIHIPDRIKEGYGPNAAGLEKLAGDGHSLVVILDSGTTAFEPIAAGRAAGLDIVVIDHHAAEPELPACEAVVNPNRLDQEPGYGYVCAAGMTWLVCRHLIDLLGIEKIHLARLLDIVALGTICDVVPLKGLNRAFVQTGLAIMNKRQNPGIAALAAVAQIENMIEAYHCGFLIGPRINAGGRIGEARSGAVLLSSDDEGECAVLASRLDALNKERQEIEKLALAEANDAVLEDGPQPTAFVLGDGWHEGIVGIVAGRLKEAYDRPSFVFSRVEAELDGRVVAKGSGRSMPGFDMGAAVIAARHAGLLVKGGGHAMAAGATLEIAKAAAFKAFLEAAIAASDYAKTGPTTQVDTVIHPAQIDVPFIKSLGRLEPFGQGNSKPRFMLRCCTVASHRILKEKHLKIRLVKQGAGIDALLFNAIGTPLGDSILEHVGRQIDLVVTLDVNEWNGRVSPQAFIEDARPAVPAQLGGDDEDPFA